MATRKSEHTDSLDYFGECYDDRLNKFPIVSSYKHSSRGFTENVFP